MAPANDHSRHVVDDDGPAAHGAGFQGSVEGALRQLRLAHNLGGLLHRQRFGVAERVLRRAGSSAAPGHDPPLVDDDGPDGAVTLGAGLGGVLQGHCHEVLVILGDGGIPLG